MSAYTEDRIIQTQLVFFDLGFTSKELFELCDGPIRESRKIYKGMAWFKAPICPFCDKRMYGIVYEFGHGNIWCGAGCHYLAHIFHETWIIPEHERAKKARKK